MMTRNLVCEMIGTFALTFIGAGSILLSAWQGQPGLVGIAFAHGLALAIAVTATMNISGGHINPAVTVTMLVTGRIKPGPAGLYIVAQCVGATIAGFILKYLFENLGAIDKVTGVQAIKDCFLGTPSFKAALVSPGLIVMLEAILTFFLLFAVFGTAVDPRAPKVGGFGIGLTVCMDILAGGPISGAAMNPARTIGTLIGGGSYTADLWSQHWVYWVGPIAGGVIAGLVYDWFIMDRSPAR